MLSAPVFSRESIRIDSSTHRIQNINCYLLDVYAASSSIFALYSLYYFKITL